MNLWKYDTMLGDILAHFCCTCAETTT